MAEYGQHEMSHSHGSSSASTQKGRAHGQQDHESDLYARIAICLVVHRGPPYQRDKLEVLTSARDCIQSQCRPVVGQGLKQLVFRDVTCHPARLLVRTILPREDNAHRRTSVGRVQSGPRTSKRAKGSNNAGSQALPKSYFRPWSS